MLNLDTFLPAFLFMTRFAESYSEGTYGSGDYNEADTDTSSPTPTQTNSPSATTSQVNNETPTTTANDQPISSTDESPRTTTTQPVTQQDTAAESDVITGTDPMWIIIASVIAVAALIGLIVAIAKKLSRS